MSQLPPLQPNRPSFDSYSTLTPSVVDESVASPSKGFFRINSLKKSASLRFLPFSAISSSLSLLSDASSSTTTANNRHSRESSPVRKPSFLSQGMDYISTRNRLVSLFSYFPHKDNYAGDNMEQVYHDLLESLSSPCPAKLNDRVLRLLLVQIGTRQTRHLVLALKDSPSDKLRPLFSGLFSERRTSWQQLFIHNKSPKLTDPYHDSISLEENHSEMPFLDFISQASRIGPSSRQAILDAGFLDFLLYMYVCDFLDPLQYHGSYSGRKGRNSPLILACNFIFLQLSNDKDNLSVILNHPLHIFWPQWDDCPFKKGSQNQTLQRRRRTWRMLDRTLLDLRFNAIQHIMSSDSEPDLLDACVDFLEFMRSGLQDVPAADKFNMWKVFGKSMATHADVKQATSAHLAQYPDDEIIDTFSYIFTEISGLFVNFREMSDWECGLIDFVITVAQNRPSSKNAIASAGLLPALLPMLKVDLRYSIKSAKTILQFSIFSESNPPMDYIVTPRLTNTISQHGLEPLLKHTDAELSGRRLLLCQAFRAHLIPMPDVLTILRELLCEEEVRNVLKANVIAPKHPD